MNYNRGIYFRGSQLFIFALLLLLTACTLPHLPTRQVQRLDLKKIQAGQLFDATALHQEWPGPSWWRQFGDAQLDQLIEQALRQSPSLHSAAARVSAAAALVGGERAALRPQLDAAVQPSYEHFTADEFIPPPYGGNTYWDNQVLLESRFDLDLWGRHHALLAAALDRLHVSTAESAQARQVLISAILTSYLRWALNKERTDYLNALLDTRTQLLALAERRWHVGLGTEIEVNSVAATLPPVQKALARARAEDTRQRDQIALLCGLPPAAGEALHAPTLHLSTLPLPARIPLRWLGRRPDVIAARWQVEADAQDIGAAKAAFYPDISLSALVGYQALGFSQLFSNSAHLYGVLPALSLPLFDGGARQAHLSAAAARRDADVAHYNDTLLRAMQEACDHWASLQSLQTEHAAAVHALALARREEDLARRGQRAGLIAASRPMQATSRRLQRTQEVADLDFASLQEQVLLIRALGGMQTQAADPHE